VTKLRVRAVIPAFLATALLLSACGSSNAKYSVADPKAKTSTAYLCQVLPRVDRLIVTRRAPGNQFTFTFPSVVTVNSASAARAVATAACALPDFPPGVYHCPAEFAVSYHLVFAVEGEKGLGGEAIDVYPTGCEVVKGLNKTRTPTPSFYRLLARTMGLRHYDNLTFAGTFTKGD
jgi:hypothetical protein